MPTRRGTAGVGLAAILILAAGNSVGLGKLQAASAPAVPAQPAAAPPAEQPGDSPGQPSGDLASEESLARFGQLLQRRPFHGPAFTGLVNHYIERDRLADLVAEYTQRVAALPDEVPPRIVLARLHLRAGDAPAAAVLLETIDRLPPDLSRLTSELLVFKSEVFSRTGDAAGAERMLKEAIGIAGSTAERLRLGEALADLYLRANDPEKAVASLRDLAAQFPDNYFHQKHIADALAQRALHDAAAEQYRAMLPLVQDQVDRRCEVLRELGQSLERLGDRDAAIAAYVEAIGLLASDHWLQRDLHERIVGLYRATSRLDDLAAYCTAQIQRAPEQTAMRILLADVQAAMNEPDLGARTLADAVALFPRDLALSQKRIEFLERQNDAEGVAAEYQRAIGQHPNDAELYISYGQYLAANRQIEAARNQWRHVLATNVSDAGFALRLGAFFESYDLQDDAAEAYERAISLSPRQPEAYTALSRLWLGRGEPDKALAVLNRMGEANPGDGAILAGLAQALQSLGKSDLALDAITRACELMPDLARYQGLRADLLVQNGRLEESLAVRREAIDRITNPVQRADAIGVLVSMHASADKLPSLKDREQARLADKPGDAVSLLLLARIADAEGDFQGVQRWLDVLLKADPGNEAALGHLARLQDATGDIDAAVATYGRLIQRHPTRSRQFYEAIVDLKLRYGDRAGAIETLESMAKNDPDGAGVLSAVAEQLVRMGEPERAIGYYERGLQQQPDRHEIRLDYGKALADAGRLEDAMAAFRAVATQRTDTDRAVEALGRLHDTATQLGLLEDLIDELHQQVEADPENTLVARALAQLLVRELEYARAMDLLDLVLRHNPRDADLALGRAELLRRLARFDEAIEAYRTVLRLPQLDRDYVLGEMGKACFESGQLDQARALWRQIGHKLYAGSLLKNNGLLDDAVSVFEEGLRLKPDDHAMHRNLIGALEAAGKTAEALDATRRLLDLEPGNAMNIERLAQAYLRAGNREEAARVASRLFGAAVGVEKPAGSGGASSSNLAMAMAQAMYSQYAGGYGYGYGGGPRRTNLERGIGFFMQSGLRAELEEALVAQIAAQPGNAVLKKSAADLFMGELNKPALALSLLRDLETAEFPLEHQSWLGQCTQRDSMRVQQYNLIAAKPALRDAELAALEARDQDALGRDELLALAIIRSAQGNTDKAIGLLTRAVTADDTDTLARGVLVDMLIAAEKFAQAEPHAVRLAELLGVQRERMQADTIERVRRDFVRSLPLEFQLRVTEDLLADIAEKWTLGGSFDWWGGGNVQTTGYLRARLNLGTIYAETGRLDDARALWRDLAPRRGPDVDRWTMLGDTAQLHGAGDLAFEFYEQALRAAKVLAGDALLQQIYASSATQMSWYGEDDTISAAFNSIIDAFAERDNLVELYDFLRDTDQQQKARRIADRYELGPKLMELYKARTEEAAGAYRASKDRSLEASVGYFAQVCKLAELHDRAGNWDAAKALYTQYLEDFPDELGLLTTLGEVAEAQLETAEAIEWEKKVIDAKTRLSKRAREWSIRNLTITPSQPQALSASRSDPWTWSMRWGQNRWGYGSPQNQLDRSSSWMRLARLYLADDNTIAAADAMQRAVADAGGRGRDEVTRQVIDLIQQRQLSAQMLPVLRTLAVYAPADERVQLAFADALEATDKPELAAEVCARLLRRGVSDLGILARVRQKLQTLDPDAAPAAATLATLEAEAAAEPDNLKTQLRLAKAYFYSLQVDRAAATLAALAEKAPHLEDVHDLLIESYTIIGDNEKLIAALRTQIERLTNDTKRRTVRWRLVDELLSAGRNDEALETVKDLADPRDPSSYVRIGALLHYFGRHDDAIACLEQAGRSQSRNPWDQDGSDFAVAQSLALRGDIESAADKILTAVDDQQRQQVQYGGAYSLSQSDQSPFASLETVFAVTPELAEAVATRLEARRAEKPTDPQTIKALMAFHRSLGRPDKAEELLQEAAGGSAADQGLVAAVIDLAVKNKDFERAASLAQRFIEQQPKPKLPPGMPPQYAGMAILQSPRTFMVCKLGDVYWDMGEHDKAFETYKQIIDEKVDETRLAYASICMLRGRVDEARTLVDTALEGQRVKPPQLLQFRAFIAALDGDPALAFDCFTEAAAPAGQEPDPYGMGSASVDLGTIASFASHTGQLDRFVTFAQERIAKTPQEWENYQVLASTLESAGRMDDALAVLDQAAAVSSLTLQALQHRINCRATVAEPDELIPLYGRLIELTEKNVGGDTQAMRYGYPMGGWGGGGSSAQPYRDTLGNLLWDQGSAEQAQKVWTERLSAQQPQTHITMGALYLAKQEHALADAAFARALKLDPDNTTAHRALAESASHRGDSHAQLAHMYECFVRAPLPGENAQQNRQYGTGFSTEFSADHRMHRWAVELSRDPSLASFLSGDDADGNAADYRLMLATLAGDWDTLEAELRSRIDAGSFDPLAWRLWARAQQRRGDWAEAARSLDFVRRAKLTSIDSHREQLELVLAGKQIKEAAAGTRQAQPGAGPAGVVQTMNYGGYNPYQNYYSYGDNTNAQLAAVYLKLKDYDKAERLYLVNSGGGVQASLPALASLMWEQRARDRSLELMRLSLLLAGDRYNTSRGVLPQYAAMLAESGRPSEAADLLIRAYRGDSSAQSSSPYNSWVGADQQFEQGYESTFAHALDGVLSRAGIYDQTLDALSKEAQADPSDARLAKLILSLQKQGRRWSQLRDSLSAWRESRPDDLAMKLEQFHAECQLGRWNDAAALLAAIRRDSPELEPRWCIHESFLHLMKSDADAAITAIAPILDDPTKLDEAGPRQAVAVLLGVTGRFERLSAHLEGLLASGGLTDQPGIDLLLRSYEAQGRWDDASALALENLWKQTEALERTDPWLRALARITSGAAAAGATLSTPDRPENAAVLTLVTAGPAAALGPLTTLAAGPDASIDSLRALTLCARLAGDDELAATANSRLLESLAPRRQSLWYTPTTPPIDDVARRFISLMGSGGTTQLALYGSVSQILPQAVQQFSQGRGVVTYESLWRSHQRLHRDLLALRADTDGLKSLLRSQARTLGSPSPDEYASASSYMGVMGLNTVMMNAPFGRQGFSPDEEQHTLAGDSRPILWRTLWSTGRLDALFDLARADGSRIPDSLRPLAAEALAAAGEHDDALRERRADAEAALAALLAADAPGLGQTSYDPWRRSWYASSTQEAWAIRSALATGVKLAPDQPERDTPAQGELNDIWELALTTPSIEQQLLRAAERIRAGSGSTPLLRQLISYHNAKGEHARIVELIELAHEPEAILRSAELGSYTRSCFEARQYDRIRAILDLAAQAGATLENDTALIRLVILRCEGADAKADDLERALLARCATEPASPHTLGRRLYAWFPPEVAGDRASARARQARSSRAYYNSYRVTYGYGYGNGQGDGGSLFSSPLGLTSELSTLADLASAIGLRLEERISADDLTIEKIRAAYQRHGLAAHAARLLDTEIDRAPTVDSRADLMLAKATELSRAGIADAATQTARELESLLTAELARRPGDAGVHWRLAWVYQSTAFGSDHERALNSFLEARRLDASFDPAGIHAVHCLYKLGRFAEAWDLCHAAMFEGRTELYTEPTLYYAALSALRAGGDNAQTSAGRRLARLALFRFPLNVLAGQVQDQLQE